jgi:protoporphyrinogen oxidase
MADQKLNELLEQLHTELEQTKSVNEEEREMLNHLNADIQKFIDPSQEDDETLFDRLQDAMDHFQVDHPAITAALSQILNSLNNAGI